MTISAPSTSIETSPFRIESERLVARCWNAGDAEAFRALLDRNNEHLRPFIPWMSKEPQTLEQTCDRITADEQRFLAGEDFRYALFDRSSDREATLIGELILSIRNGNDSREIGYLIDKSMTGQGLAFEAACLLTKTAFMYCNTRVVELYCSPDNQGSVRIAEKLGFGLREILKDHSEDSEGRMSDSMIWELLAENFPDSIAARLAIKAFNRDGEQL